MNTWVDAFQKMICLLILCGIASYAQAGAEKQLVAGAGPSTKVVSLFFEHFAPLSAADGFKFVVPPRSVKHAGGIKASDEYFFGRTGRPLSEKEKHKNKEDIFIARIPLTFVAGLGVSPMTLTAQQLEDILLKHMTNWQDVGGPDAPIVLVGREKTEASLTILRPLFPFIDNAKFDQIFTRDHRIVNFLKSPLGEYGLGFGAKSNFEGLSIINVQGVEAGIEIGLVYDLKNSDHPIIKAAKQYASSKVWGELVTQAGYLPPN